MIIKSEEEKCKFYPKKTMRVSFSSSLNLRAISFIFFFHAFCFSLRLAVRTGTKYADIRYIKPNSTRNQHLNTFIPSCMHARRECTQKYIV